MPVALLLLLAWTPAGCDPFPETQPPVADSLMVEVLLDLHLADARAARYHDVPPAIRDSVLHHHGLARADYDAAVAFYDAHPEAYGPLYAKLLDRLNTERLPLQQ